ncbi:hypothetical protein DFJ77DRAFT_43376 [Powellomyces hirtus]|nr:hypothetical protein DFJ77DRAFT_43376 [Powellomyces hirtus]
MDIWPFQPDLTARDYEAEELEELEAAEAGIAPVVRPVLEWAPGCDTQAAKTPQLLLLGLPGAGALFLNGRFQKRKFVGSMRFPSAEVKGSAWEKQMLSAQTFTLYELVDEPSTLIVICQYDISSELSPAWADVFFTHIQPQRTMIFDSMTEYQFKQASEETAPPLLRKLKTTLAHEIDAVEHLAPPSIITGPAAAFLTWVSSKHQIPMNRGSTLISFSSSKCVTCPLICTSRYLRHNSVDTTYQLQPYKPSKQYCQRCQRR